MIWVSPTQSTSDCHLFLNFTNTPCKTSRFKVHNHVRQLLSFEKCAMLTVPWESSCGSYKGWYCCLKWWIQATMLLYSIWHSYIIYIRVAGCGLRLIYTLLLKGAFNEIWSSAAASFHQAKEVYHDQEQTQRNVSAQNIKQVKLNCFVVQLKHFKQTNSRDDFSLG